MRVPRSLSSTQLNSLCLLLIYTLAISLFAPFATKRVEAAPAGKGGDVSARKNALAPVKAPAPVVTNPQEQKSGWREGELLVRFREHAPAQKMNALLRSNGAQWNGQLRGGSGVERLRLAEGSNPEAVASIMRSSELIEFAEPNYLITADQTASQTVPDDPRFSEQWALKNTGAAQAWSKTTGSKQTVIAIIDSGIDFTHPDIINNQWDNTLERPDGKDEDGNSFNDDLHGWDFVTNSQGIIDAQGHGTAVAGIIAAQGNNSIGISGMMWQVSLMSLRVLDKTGTGDIAGAVEAIDYATMNGAQVINCSWGTDYNSTALLEAISRADKRGVVVVTSAGNSSRDIETTPHYPASYELPNLITVASTDGSDQLTSFSNWGERHVSIAAPGAEILTTKLGGDYETISGSSASAPFVTGIAGLIKTLRPWLGADRTREMILRGARTVPSLTDKVASKGIINAAGALKALDALPPHEGLDEGNGNNGGEHGAAPDSGENNRGGRTSNRATSINPDRNRNGDEFKVTPPARTQGVPSSDLPNLDELKRKKPINPKAIDPVPSTRCSHKDPDCASERRKASVESPTGLLAWGGDTSPAESVLTDSSHAISDSPFRLFWSSPSSSPASMPLPQPQTPRTNFALASNGGVATASSALAGYSPDGAINGDRRGLNWGSSGGWADSTVNTFPDWIQIDFDSPKSIDEIDVFGIQDNYQSPIEPTASMIFSLYGLPDFQVQYLSGTNWITVPGGSITGNNLVWKKLTFSAITTTKLRVVVNNANGYSRVSELEVYGVPAPVRTNVALAANGGVATASSALAGYSPDGAINGDRKGLNWSNGGGWADATVNTFPDWLQVEFNNSKTIDEIDVIGVQDNYQSPVEPTPTLAWTLYGLPDFQVQYWSGSAWITVPGGSVSGNNLIWRQFTFSPVTTNKIRVVGNNALYGHCRITELEAYGTDAGTGGNVVDYSTTRVDPINRTGTGGVDLISGNANWSIPILGLKGRAGLDLSLSLTYNSLVWTKSQDGASIKFDSDRGTPSPGFRLGFPTIQPLYYNPQVGRSAYLLITPSGSHVELRQVGSTNGYESGDSSYLRLTDNGGGSLTLRPPDGSELSYDFANGQYHCNKIKDRNGNFISINYHSDGRINTVTDTLARVVTFNYDGYLNLISITQDWGGANHTWATFGWTNITLSTAFSGLTLAGVQNGTIIPVLSQVSFADGTHYNFEYNGYGQVNKVRHYAEDNHPLSYTSYTHTLPAGSNDCPRVTETRVSAEYWSGQNGVPAEVITQYSRAADYSSGQMTMPDGTIYKELYATAPNWKKGLETGTEYWSGGVKKKWTTTTHAQSDTNLPYQKNPRVTETNIYDSDGNRKRAVIEYNEYPEWGLPSRVIEYAADGATEIRHTFTGYNMSQAYVDKRIIGLVRAVHVSDTYNWQSIVYYDYDAGGAQLAATTNPTIQHDNVNYGNASIVRGNLTTVTRYDATDPNNVSKRVATQIGYDTNGSVIFTKDPLDHKTIISYNDYFSDNLNHNTYAYPTKITPPLALNESASSFESTSQYNYAFGAVTRTQGPLPDVHTQGPVQTIAYDSAGRISRIDNLVNNAYKQWVYDPAGHVSVKTKIETGGQETTSSTVFDGLGRVRGTSSENPNSQGLYSAQYTYYDLMGRVFKQSNPAEVTSSWAPAGDDSAGWTWTLQDYDWKGRPTITTNPDGTTKEATYGGCGCAGGEVVTIRDEAGRQQRVTSDVLGRQRKTEVLDWYPSQTVHSSTTNSYNALDQLTSVYDTGLNVAGQTTTLTYDGHGRLKTKQAPSQTSATTYIYNADDTPHSVTDARGVVSTFTYNNRHQTTGISYTTVTGIAPTANVTLGYDAAGNRTSMTDGSGSVTYHYDQLSRLTSEDRQFADLAGITKTLSYGYNLAGGLTSITDPDGKVINYTYDKTGRMTDITGTSFGNITQYATNIRQRAWGALKSASYGDDSSLTASYNSRLLPTDFAISGSISKHYEYYDDGRLKYSRNNGYGALDRSYTYDHAGRVTEAFSGPLARGQADTDQRPYKLTYQYDAFNHLTAREGNVWSAPTAADTGSGIYSNDKNTGWSYDADGRLIDSLETQYAFDAAGRAVSVVSVGAALTQEQVFDGDGQRTKLRSQQDTYHEDTYTWTTETKTQYFVTSSVLGAVVTELDQTGQKTRTFVYQGGEVLAWQQKIGTSENITWEHRDASDASVRFPGILEGEIGAELEPMGSAAATHPPLIYPWQQESSLSETRSYPALADLLGGQCNLDGMPIPCSDLNHRMDMGFVATEYLYRDVKKNGDQPALVPNRHGVAAPLTIVWQIETREIRSFGLGVFLIDYPYLERDKEDEGIVWGETMLAHLSSPQNSGSVAKFDLERFKSCLEIQFNTKLGISDGRTQGFDINSGSFYGIYNNSIGFSVRIDSTSKSGADITQFGRQSGRLSSTQTAIGMSDIRNPDVVYIASDKFNNRSPAYRIATQVHEIGNKIDDKFGVYGLQQPHASSRLRNRLAKINASDDDAGIALEECVFGGYVLNNGRVFK